MAYGYRLTRKHAATLVPGSAAFFLPEALGALGRPLPWAALRLLYKAILAALLLWHALDLSDRETAREREQALQGISKHSGNFFLSTGLYWAGNTLLALPVAWLACGGAGLDCFLDAASLKSLLLSPGRLLIVLASALPFLAWLIYGWFHGYYVADEGQGAWESIRSSFKAVRGAELQVTLFCAVIGLMNAAGLAAYLVGVFFAFPVTLMATTHVHLELKRQTFQ